MSETNDFNKKPAQNSKKDSLSVHMTPDAQKNVSAGKLADRPDFSKLIQLDISVWLKN